MQTADEFLATGQKFQLGFLETEKPNPKTLNLSSLAQNDLKKACETMAEVDFSALEILKAKTEDILRLRKDIEDTWASGGKVYMCGCGATGRLSLTIETLYLEQNPNAKNVVAFMAGGDVALVHSLEGFEDFPEYGERHLKELGFGENDLLLSPTEGGETPYVIGATEAAARISKRKPYFLYCNPDEILIEHVERSRNVIQNPKINKINLTVGPMALAGSTRMQASTVLQLTIGFALLTKLTAVEIKQKLSDLQALITETAPVMLPPFIEREADEYKAGRYVLYCVKDYSITVFTDTTERAPTFSLTPFSHMKATRLLKLKPSLSYVSLAETKNATEAWQALLHRKPRPLNWAEIDERTNADYLNEFDFSIGARKFRSQLTSGAEHNDFQVGRKNGSLFWSFQELSHGVLVDDLGSSLLEHTFLKMLINIHSTLVMGRLGRFERNMMTWVYPTNGKLIDRSTRYVLTLLKQEGVTVTYEQVVRKLFELKSQVSGNESIVLAAYRAYSTA